MVPFFFFFFWFHHTPSHLGACWGVFLHHFLLSTPLFFLRFSLSQLHWLWDWPLSRARTMFVPPGLSIFVSCPPVSSFASPLFLHALSSPSSLCSFVPSSYPPIPLPLHPPQSSCLFYMLDNCLHVFVVPK
ncbi:hypothetical protein M378DRAFT_911469 [Amanita muscaria Koide BX008]|uniref:Uncharacterized protein n=1 Tax=Amanita muscaria (strain Koide BX008) TaxID=946122 RepID=A0A0C2SCQ3_AMAMK|nr:hypothetical protein M378DRAFT_911469 [Amanita muscaria Koide BX008]